VTAAYSKGVVLEVLRVVLEVKRVVLEAKRVVLDVQSGSHGECSKVTEECSQSVAFTLVFRGLPCRTIRS
jgi:hypothetical protein